MKLPVENYVNVSREYCSSTEFVVTGFAECHTAGFVPLNNY